MKCFLHGIDIPPGHLSLLVIDVGGDFALFVAQVNVSNHSLVIKADIFNANEAHRVWRMLDNTPSGFGDLLSICVDMAPSVGFRLCQSFSSLSEALKYPSTQLFITDLEALSDALHFE